MRLDDGLGTAISFSAAPGLKIYEKEVTPPGIQAGGANDTTTLRNTALRTKAPKRLKTMSDGGAKVAYDPEVYDDMDTMIGVNQLITVTFSDGAELDFWGWIDEFNPDAIKEGEQPTADIKIIPSNQDDDGEETGPVFRGAA